MSELAAKLQQLVDEYGGDEVSAALMETSWGTERKETTIAFWEHLANRAGEFNLPTVKQNFRFSDIKMKKHV